MPRWTVSVVRVVPVKDGGEVVALADVRIDEMIQYGFRINRDKEEHMWVSNPQAELDGRHQDTMGFLDTDLRDTVDEIVIQTYLHPYREPTAEEE